MASPKIPRQRELLSLCIRPEFTQVVEVCFRFFLGVPNKGNRANVTWNKATWRVDFGDFISLKNEASEDAIRACGMKCVRWFFSPWSWGVIFCLNMVSNGVVTLPAGVSLCSFLLYDSFWRYHQSSWSTSLQSVSAVSKWPSPRFSLPWFFSGNSPDWLSTWTKKISYESYETCSKNDLKDQGVYIELSKKKNNQCAN